jgi:tripartite-type tricarboxylate transporter receptor subunit TctC
VRKLQDETVRALAQPDVRERLEALGFEPSGISGEEFGKYLAADIARLTTVARAANIKAD